MFEYVVACSLNKTIFPFISVTLTVLHIVLKNLPVAEPKGVKVGMSPNAVGTSPNAAETSQNVAETSLKNEWFAVPLLLRNVVISKAIF